MLGSAAFRNSPHAIIYVHCAKLREVDTTTVLEAAMADQKRWVGSFGRLGGWGGVGLRGSLTGWEEGWEMQWAWA